MGAQTDGWGSRSKISVFEITAADGHNLAAGRQIPSQLGKSPGGLEFWEDAEGGNADTGKAYRRKIDRTHVTQSKS